MHQEIAVLKLSLQSALDQVKIIGDRIQNLEHKQDVIAVDCSGNTARLDILEQHRDAQPDWWEEEEVEEVQAAAGLQQPGEQRGVVTANGNERLLNLGTQLNANMHTLPHSARENGGHEVHHQAPLVQDLEHQRLQHLSRPPALGEHLHQGVGRELTFGQGFQKESLVLDWFQIVNTLVNKLIGILFAGRRVEV